MRLHVSKTPYTLYLYVAREFAVFFIVLFLFFFIVFFINQIIYMAQDILSKKAPVFDVIKLVIYALPSIVAMSFPYATFVGGLMALGRLMSEKEILVMSASGVPKRKIFLPFLVLGFIFSWVSFIMNDYFLPLGMLNYQRVYRNLILSTPALELKPFSVKKYKDSVIITGSMNKSTIQDITVIDRTKDGKNRVITAHNARIVNSEENNDILMLILEQVMVQETDPQYPDRFEYTEAELMEYNIVLTQFTSSSSQIGAAEMGVANLINLIEKKKQETEKLILSREQEYQKRYYDFSAKYFSQNFLMSNLDSKTLALKQELDILKDLSKNKILDRGIEIYRIELYKKLAIPFSAICFIILAFPLGIFSNRSSIGRNFIIGLAIVIANWFLLLGGQSLAVRGIVSAFWGIWFANILTICAGILLTIIRLKK